MERLSSVAAEMARPRIVESAKRAEATSAGEEDSATTLFPDRNAGSARPRRTPHQARGVYSGLQNQPDSRLVGPRLKTPRPPVFSHEGLCLAAKGEPGLSRCTR
jgi:hypothetical protein